MVHESDDVFTISDKLEISNNENKRLKKADYRNEITKFFIREWLRKNWWALVILLPAFISVVEAVIGIHNHPEWLHGGY